MRGRAREEIPRLAEALGVSAVFANHDYEPAAIDRDEAVQTRLAAAGRELRTFKDQVIFERDEVLTGAGTPFSVFTPYKNAWLKKLNAFYLSAYGRPSTGGALAKPTPRTVDAAMPTLDDLGFRATNLRELRIPTGMSGARALLEDFLPRIDAYRETRDFPAVKGPSYLSVHLRFGTVSIRELARAARTPSAGRARARGCRNSSGATSTSRCSRTIRT